MKTFKSVPAAILFFCASLAVAHGEDQPGPHGGAIRMPGPFHTELIVTGKNEVKVYLLDMSWKNPSVRDSNVEVAFAARGNVKAGCKKKSDFFLCTFDPSVDLKSKGTIQLTATREKQKGNLAEYPTPLKP